MEQQTDNNDSHIKNFVTYLEKLLIQFYGDLKKKGIKDVVVKSRIEGYMLAGTKLNIVSEDELHALMERVHFDVFGMTISERRLQEIKGEPDSVDWDYYDKPPSQRRTKN